MPQVLSKKDLLQKLQSHRNGRQFEIRLGYRVYKIHKFMADVFFDDAFSDNIDLVDVDPRLLEKVIALIYGNSPLIRREEHQEFLHLANMLKLRHWSSGDFPEGLMLNLRWSDFDIKPPNDVTVVFKTLELSSSSVRLQLTSMFFDSCPTQVDFSRRFSLSEAEFWDLFQYLNSEKDLCITKNNALRYIAAAEHFRCQQLVDSCWSFLLENYPSPSTLVQFFQNCTELELKSLLNRSLVCLFSIPDDLKAVPLSLEKAILLASVVDLPFLQKCLKLMPLTVTPGKLRSVLKDPKLPSDFKILLLELLELNQSQLDDVSSDFLVKNFYLLKNSSSVDLWRLALNSNRCMDVIGKSISSMEHKDLPTPSLSLAAFNSLLTVVQGKDDWLLKLFMKSVREGVEEARI
ncbi:hypothetical protein GEMRC1_002178 [Eukaryota sp. GEM-RC1]